MCARRSSKRALDQDVELQTEEAPSKSAAAAERSLARCLLVLTRTEAIHIGILSQYTVEPHVGQK
jgi:hypothetical protein